MKSRPETPAPPPGPIAADEQTQRKGVYGWRPLGTKDWLITYTIGGKALYRLPEGEYLTGPGDLVLIPPGTPHDYEVHPETGFWRVIWIHFLPRLDQLDLLHWPALGSGVFRLPVPVASRRTAQRHLREAVRHVHQFKVRSQQCALNAIERMLLDCDAFNPRNGGGSDPRIDKAIAYIHRSYAASPSLDEMARHAGLSRTRFIELFQRQEGEPPRRYVEKLRLLHARQLWEYGRLTLGEIAERLHFSSPYYLSLRFKREFGKSPRFHRRARRWT